MLPRCKYLLIKRGREIFNTYYSQLGAQFDGYCSTVATTIVVGAKGPVTGPKADVIKAAETALEAAIRLIRPGNKVI